jgi:phosphate-selective porin
MSKILTRLVGTAAATATAGTLLMAAPASAAQAAPASAPTAAATSTVTAVKAGERNTKVSRSMRGVRDSAYVGKYYSKRYERTRKCIVRKESGGNYRIASRSGKYKGAYQFNANLARHTARKMGRPDLARKPFNQWSRFHQDKAFWTVWNHGKGRGHWPTARGC